jgi:hypothetical protein
MGSSDQTPGPSKAERLSAECDAPSETLKCPAWICAIRLIQKAAGGTKLEVCGDGYNEQTVRVRVGTEILYVFRRDLCLP